MLPRLNWIYSCRLVYIISSGLFLFSQSKFATDMQFEIGYSIKQTTFKVISSNFKHNVVNSLGLSYERIGGKFDFNTNTWIFPPFINLQIIEEVIHNTCFVCGGLMKDSTAMVDQKYEFEHDLYGTVTQTIPGHAKQIKVRKCSSCGHSHT
jgi:hypothetical protein